VRSAQPCQGVRACVSFPSLPPTFLLSSHSPPFHNHSTTDKPESLSAQVFITFTVSKTGATRLSAAPTFYSPEKVQADVKVSDATAAILARPLKPKAQKKKKDAKAE
jgi:hypothetical protein